MWLIQLLLLLYPKPFREEYGREIAATFRSRWREGERFGLVFSTALDIIWTALGQHLEMLGQDVRYSLRSLRTNPGFTVAAISTLALGIGATTAIFTLFHAVLLKPLPFRNPDRIVRILDTNPKQNIGGFANSVRNFSTWREKLDSFEALAAFQITDLNLTGDGNPERLSGMTTYGPFWKVLGIQPAAGRVFSPEEDEPGKDRVAMISERIWERRWGRDPNIVGRTIEVGGQNRVIVGVAPSELGFRSDVDMWIPLAPVLSDQSRGDRRISAIGLIRRDVSRAQALGELNRLYAALAAEFPKENEGWQVRFLPAKEWIIDDNTRTSLQILLGAVFLLLLIAAANVANLLLARAAARGREVGVRLAMGASRSRLVRQMLTESLVLAAVGGGLGVAVAGASLRGILALLPENMPGTWGMSIELPILLFAGALTLGTGILFGLAPALIAAKGDIHFALQSAGRTSVGGRRTPLRQMLVTAQVAMATMLVVGALFMIQSFTRLIRTDLGFPQDHLLTARFSPAPSRYNDGEKSAAYYRALLAEVSAIPGVESAGITSEIPLGPVNTQMRAIATERSSEIQQSGVQAPWRLITNGYLDTLRIPLLKGRRWAPNEDFSRRPMAISAELARRLWPQGEDPIGRTIRLSNGYDFTVIAVMGDIRQVSASERQPTATMYFPADFLNWFSMTIVARTKLDPMSIAGALRAAVQKVDPSQPLYEIRTMEDFIVSRASRQRLWAVLLGLFAGLALLLGAVGVAGVVSYSVSRRIPELALRMALGASSGRVMGEVTRVQLLLCVAGLVAGLGGAWALRQIITPLLFQTRPDSLAPFAFTTATLLLVALLACWLPARRVTRIDPAVALRNE